MFWQSKLSTLKRSPQPSTKQSLPHPNLSRKGGWMGKRTNQTTGRIHGGDVESLQRGDKAGTLTLGRKLEQEPSDLKSPRSSLKMWILDIYICILVQRRLDCYMGPMNSPTNLGLSGTAGDKHIITQSQQYSLRHWVSRPILLKEYASPSFFCRQTSNTIIYWEFIYCPISTLTFKYTLKFCVSIRRIKHNRRDEFHRYKRHSSLFAEEHFHISNVSVKRATLNCD